MERDTSEPVTYSDFTHIIRDAAQVDAAVCRVFNLPIPRVVRGDFRDYISGNLAGSYVRLRSKFSINKFVEGSRSELRDYVLDTVIVPPDAEASMDWEDFIDLVETVIDTIWKQVQSDSIFSEASYLEAV